MKKVIMSIMTIAISAFGFGQANIEDARNFALGQTVTVSGVATNGSELGPIRYMQDNTAGIAAYGGPIGGVNRYDSITVTGPLIEFSGLLEISTVTNVVNHGPAVIQPVPLELPFSAIDESKESQLARVINVTFNQTGNFAGNTTYTVSDGSTNLDVRINTGTNMVGTAIPAGPVTITGPIGQFNANYQIVPRDLNDIVAYVAPAFEINVKINGNTVLHNSNYFMGNSPTLNITIENQGVSDLVISGHTFSGANAGDFSTDIVAGNIAALSDADYTLTYTPGGTGSRFGTIEIASNDTDENPYIINFEAVGTDNIATEPTANPTSLTFPSVEAYTLSGEYNAGTGASSYLVLWKNGSAITGAPVDGTSYQRGDVVGDAKVAYVGSGTSFTPRGIIAEQDYYFEVYAFNGTNGFENYLTTAPASDMVTSLGKNSGSYYAGLSTAAPTFISDLTTIINPHTMITYFMYKQTMMQEFEVKDTTAGQSYVTCAYSGERKVFSGPFDWTATNYSREHVFPHSWMPTNPANSPERPEYTDQFNLFPVNFPSVNAVRSNYPLGEVVTVTSSFLGGTYGQNADGRTVYEPRDEMKGDIARAMMYEAVSYNGTSGIWAFPNPISFIIQYGQDQEVIKNWHFADLPDAYEIARNEYIYNLQGNRNPFIDSTDLVCFIDFSNMSYINGGCLATINELTNENVALYPNPAKDEVQMRSTDGTITGYTIVDLQGREVANVNSLNAAYLTVDVDQFNAGSYIVNIQTTKGIAQRKLIVN